MQNVETTVGADGSLTVGARTIPLPASVSEAARKCLATPMPQGPQPAATDKAAWKELVQQSDKMFEPLADAWLRGLPASVETIRVGHATVYVGTPHQMRYPDRAHLTIHGGAWVFLGGKFAMGDAARAAATFGCMAYSVDYRMPPDHPYPAAVDDCLDAYRYVVERHDAARTVISGASAGGNLTAAVTLKLRDAGLPLPGAVGLMTPALDLTRTGDTLFTNNGVDTVLRPFGNAVALYAGGHAVTDPYLSPLLGDLTKGFPPTFLQSGTRDVLLSDTVRMHRALVRAGVPAELNVWEAMPHGGFAVFGEPTPEDREISEAFVDFIDRQLG
jgi:monoterpene epsilon-lactone hydrolase